MIDYNYHTHTFRCGHASGMDKDYIEEAISRGFKVLGFSDHILFEDNEKVLLNDYVNSLKKLKEEYKDKIEIHIGFECEHLPGRPDYYKYLLEDKGIEYLILGQHYLPNGNGKTINMFKDVGDPKEIAERYYQSIKEGVESGMYAYIAHPDLFARDFKEYDEVFFEYARKICKLAKEHNMPLEINLNGLYNVKVRHITGPRYPSEEFFKIAGEVGNDVIVGVDAHSPLLIRKAKYKWAEKIIKKYNLHHITRLKL